MFIVASPTAPFVCGPSIPQLEIARIRSPQVTGWLRALVNVAEAIEFYLPFVYPEFETLITDFTWQGGCPVIAGYPVLPDFPSALSWARSVFTNALIGNYVGGTFVTYSSDILADSLLNPTNSLSYNWRPIGTLIRDGLNEDDLISAAVIPSDGDRPHSRFADIRKPTVRTNLVAQILAHSEAAGTSIQLLDNVGDYDTSGAITGITTATALTYLQQIFEGLQLQNKQFGANISTLLSVITHANAAQLGLVTYFVTIETYALDIAPTVAAADTGTNTALTNHVARVQDITANGCILIYLPAGLTYEHIALESLFWAAMSMIIGNCMVSWPFFLNPATYFPGNNYWFDWPERFGAPTGDITIVGTTISREFENGSLSANGITRIVTVDI